MSAPEALRAARPAGIKIGLDKDDLVLEASAPPPAAASANPARPPAPSANLTAQANLLGEQIVNFNEEPPLACGK